MRRLLVSVLALVACGDNLGGAGPALQPASELVVVAHPGDDLLLMQPDVLEVVEREVAVTLVYVTAGNGQAPSDGRHYRGLREAYGYTIGSDAWQCGWIEIDGRAAQHCRLAHVSLVFLDYPDGGKDGEYADSLLKLWEGDVASVRTVGDVPTTYDRDGLIETLAAIIRETQPVVVRTLEVASTHGRDHSDHMVVGALTVLAMAAAQNRAELLAYRGDAINLEPPNMLPVMFDASAALLNRYEACAGNCGAACGEACTALSSAHTDLLLRRYTVGFRRSASGKLRSGADCVANDLSLVTCSNAPSWRYDEHGQLRNPDARCIAVGAAGELVLADCLGGRERRFFLDDEGHFWSAVPPPPGPDLDYAHLSCLAPVQGQLRLQVCGEDRAPAWEVVPRTIETPRADINFFATGRDVRLGDLTRDGHADLCAVDNGLYCAPGDGSGGFELAIRLDIGVPLAIDPKSLTLGDVDGDDALDACGRTADGILCATAADQFSAVAWSPAFNDMVARVGTSASLAAVDADADGTADICGVDRTGVICAPRGLMIQPIVRSPWPASRNVVWPADLDGDQQADWCTATDDGPACAVEAHRERTTDGVPWGFALAGNVDVAPENTATVALADIDGDGRADLCAPREDRILCARSHGRGFGPRTTTLAILPNQSVASALWLGDLNGDGRADACADTGASITCAVEP